MIETHYQKGMRLVSLAASGKPEDILKCLEDGANIHFENDRALLAAAITGHFENVKVLVEKGANVGAAYSAALLYAAKRGDHDVVEFLIARGAKIEDVLQHHKKEVDQACREALYHPQSQKLHDDFEASRRKIKDKVQSRKKPKLKKDL